MRNRSFGHSLLIMVLTLAACTAPGVFEPSDPAPVPSPTREPPPPLPEYRGPATRPFLMGFTLWPADLNEEGVAIAREYAHAHGDIVSVMFIGGIPWPEALDGKPFSKDVQEQHELPPAGWKKTVLVDLAFE